MATGAFSRAVEIVAAGFRISSEHILHAVSRGASQRVIELLFQEVRKLFDLFWREGRAGRVALCRVAFSKERPDLTAIPVAEYGERADKIRSAFTSTCLGSMTGNAFRDVRRLATIRRGCIDGLFVTGSRTCGRLCGKRKRNRPDDAQNNSRVFHG